MRSQRAIQVLTASVMLFTVALLGPIASAAPVDVGTITKFTVPTPQSYPSGITAGPDGNVWFTETNANQIARITPSGRVREFPVPTPMSFPHDITAGPDGNLWFTEPGLSTDKVASITPDGTITEFSVPYRPYGITTGPDGNLWFTQTDDSQIGRITPTGALTEYPLPPLSNPLDITAGPDGSLWFIESGAIGRITPSGTVTNFPVTFNEFSITAGPDGNLWFTSSPRTICRMTTSGVVTAFIVPTPSALVRGITSGPDGNLWFTEYKAAKIGQITTAGVITEFPIPGNRQSQPPSITAGPDANLWFTMQYNNQVGRITDAPVPAVSLSPNSGPPGTLVQASGSGFGSFETVVLTFVDSGTGETNLERVLTDSSGHFSTTVRVPANATLGPQTVRASGTISALVVNSTFTVT